MGSLIDRLKKEAEQEIQTERTSEQRKTAIRQTYGSEKPTFEQIEEQAGLYNFQSGEKETSIFLVNAVGNGVISRDQARSIYKKLAGKDLFAEENISSAIDYGNGVIERRFNNNIPVWREEQSAGKYDGISEEDAKAELDRLYGIDPKKKTPQERSDFDYLTKKLPDQQVSYLSDKVTDLEKEASDITGRISALNQEKNKINRGIYTGKNKAKRLEEIEAEIKSLESRKKHIAAEVSRKNKEKTLATRRTEFIRLSSANNSESEFYDKDYDRFVKTGNNVPYTEFGSAKTRTVGTDAPTVIRVPDKYRAAAMALAEHNGIDVNLTNVSEDEIRKFRNMTFSEFETFAYWLGKDEEQAKKYIDSIEETLSYREGAKINKETKGFWGNFDLAVIAGLEDTVGGIRKKFNKEDYYADSPHQAAANLTSQELAEEGRTKTRYLFEGGRAASGMIPSVLTSTALSLINPAAGAKGFAGTAAKYLPKFAGLAVMGASANGNAYAEMINLGYGEKEATAYGNLVGASEVLLELLPGGISKLDVFPSPLASLLSKVDNVLGRTAIKYAGAFGGEFLEEGGQAFLEPIYKEMALGYSTGEERDWEEILHNALVGGFVGMFFESPEIVFSEGNAYLTDKKTGKKINLNQNTEAFLEEAKRLGVSQNKIDKIIKGGSKDRQVGTLLRRLVDDGKISASQAEELVTTGLNGAPLNEDAQVYFYAGASGVSFMDAAKLGEDLSIDGETAYAAWKKGTEIRAKNDKARFKPEASLANPTLAEAVSDSKNNAPGIIDRKGRRITAKGVAESRNSVGDSSVRDSSATPQNDKTKETTPQSSSMPAPLAQGSRGEAYIEAADKYRTEENAKEFDEAYNIGLAGETLDGFTPDADITSMTKAYMAGVHDKAAFREREAQRTTFNATRKGLSSDNLTETLIKRCSAKTREVLQNLGEALGVQIKLITNSSIAGHEMDSYYDSKAGVIAINVNEVHRNPKIKTKTKDGSLSGDDLIRFVAAHEGIHRIRETSPKAYAQMEKIALSKSKVTVSEYMKEHDVSEAIAKEEITADYFGDLLTNKAEIKALLNKNRGLFDIIWEVLKKIGRVFSEAGIDFAEIAEARRLFREALKEADSSVWGEDARGEGDALLSKSEKEVVDKTKKDPTKLTEKDFKILLQLADDKKLADDTYIPARINTPLALIVFAREHGKNLENHPLAMSVYKARQALANEAEWDGNFRDKPHDLTIEEVVDIVKAMNSPSYLVYQTNNERFAEIVKFDKDGEREKAYAIIDFFDVDKNPEYMNGYKGGKYNILVTIYPSESSSELKDYLKNKNNIIMTGEDIKKKVLSQRGSGSFVPSHLNDMAFFDDSISEEKTVVKDESSDKIRSRSEDGTKYFPKGEAPRRDIDVPSEIGKKKVMRGARTAAEAPGVSEEVAEDIPTEIENGRFFYTPSVNALLMANAQSRVSEDYDEAMADWLKVVGGGRVRDVDIALGEALIIETSKRGDAKKTMDLICDLAILANEAGKAVQAMRLLKRMSPEGQLMYINKVAETITDKRSKDKGKKFDASENEKRKVRKFEEATRNAEADVKAKEKTVSDLEGKIEALTDLVEAENEVSAMDEEMKALKRELSILKSEIKKQNADKDKLSSEIDFLTRQIKEQSEMLLDAIKRRDSILSERGALSKELNAIKREAKDADEASDRIFAEIEILEEDISDASKKLDAAKKFRDELTEERKKLGAERRTLIEKTKSADKASEKDLKRISELNNEIMDLSDKLEVASKNAEDAAEVRRKLVDERNRLKGKLKRAENAISRENGKAEKYRKDILELLSGLKAADEALAEAKAKREVAKAMEERAKEAAKLVNRRAGIIEIPTDIADAILKAKSEEELNDAVELAKDYIAANIEPTWAEKIRAWRYMAMLGNARTQIRNLLGNALMLLPVMTKNGVASVIEPVAEYAVNSSVEKQIREMEAKGATAEEIEAYRDSHRFTRSKSAAVLWKNTPELKAFTEESWKANEKMAMEGGKYDNIAGDINDRRQIFGNKLLEAYRKGTSNAMEAGDRVFLRLNYKWALTGYMIANKLTPDTITEAQKLQAEQYALKEAREATFRDKSRIAQEINRIKGLNWGTELLIGGIFPFTQTPINVTKRAFEYSPIGIANVVSDIVNYKGGKVEITDVINSIAKMATGSAIVYIGFMLAAEGLLRSTGDDEDEEYDYLVGEQDYALKIGNYRYSIDWASPSAIPLLFGAAIYEGTYGADGGIKQHYKIVDGKKVLNTSYVSISSVLSAAGKMFAPIFEVSYLSGFADAIDASKGVSGDAGATVMTFAGEAALSFGGQFVPTWMGQIARSIDVSERRNNDYNRTLPIPYTIQKGAAKILNKIPGVNMLSTPYVDPWGEEQEKDSAWDYAVSIFENLVSPGYIEEVTDDELTKELWRIEKATGGEKKVFPTAVGYKHTETVDGVEKQYDFTPEQHIEWQRVTGKTGRKIIGAFVESDGYEDLTDDARAKAIDLLWDYAKAEGIAKVFPDYKSSNTTVQKMQAAGKNLEVTPEDYVYIKLAVDMVDKPNDNGDLGTYTQDEYEEALGLMSELTGEDLTGEQLAYIWQAETDGNTKNNKTYGKYLRGTPWWKNGKKDGKTWMKER